MEIRPFPSLGDAERYVKRSGYLFQGAPSRWRKQDGKTTSYADIRPQGHGAVVIITDVISTGVGG